MNEELMQLSTGQKLVAYALQLYPGSPVNNIGGLLLVEDDLDFILLKKSLDICVQRNDALRLRIVKKKKKLGGLDLLLKNVIHQYVANDRTAIADLRDYSNCTEDEMEQALLRINSVPIDIYAGPLYEFTMVKGPGGRCGIFAKLDHLITDAYMSTLLCTELMDVYYALKHSEELPKPLYPFTDFLKGEEAYLKSPQYAADKEFWRGKFHKRPTESNFNLSKSTSATGATKRYTKLIDSGTAEKIRDFCKEKGITESTLFNVLVGLCLSRRSGLDDVCINTPVMLRSTIREKRTCGPLVNNYPLRMYLDGVKTFAQACQEVNTTRLECMKHLRYPALHLMGYIFLKFHTSNLSDCLLSFQPALIKIKENVNISFKWYPSGVFANPLSLYISDMGGSGVYELQWEYQVDIFSADFVEKTHDELMAYLRLGMAGPETNLDEMRSSV